MYWGESGKDIDPANEFEAYLGIMKTLLEVVICGKGI